MCKIRGGVALALVSILTTTEIAFQHSVEDLLPRVIMSSTF